MSAMSTALQSISDAITNNTSLKQSPQSIDAKTVPNAGTNSSFSINIQTANSGQGRDRGHIRLVHDVSVNILWRMKMNSQFESQKDALDVEETTLDALVNQSNIVGLSVFYSSTRRTILGSKEYMLIEMSFKMTHDIVIVS